MQPRVGNSAGRNLAICHKLVLNLKSVFLEGGSDFIVATEAIQGCGSNGLTHTYVACTGSQISVHFEQRLFMGFRCWSWILVTPSALITGVTIQKQLSDWDGFLGMEVEPARTWVFVKLSLHTVVCVIGHCWCVIKAPTTNNSVIMCLNSLCHKGFGPSQTLLKMSYFKMETRRIHEFTHCAFPAGILAPLVEHVLKGFLTFKGNVFFFHLFLLVGG